MAPMSTSSALEDAELPVDLSQLPSIPAAKSLLLINNFVANTTRFLNHFAHECEERITRVSDNVTRVEILLAILEAKLNSIPDLNVSDAAVNGDDGHVNLNASQMDLGISDQDLPSMEANGALLPPPPPPPEEEGASIDGESDGPPVLKLKDDPAYAKYFTMRRLGIPEQVIEHKLLMDGMDTNILNMDPEGPSPSGGLAPMMDSEPTGPILPIMAPPPPHQMKRVIPRTTKGWSCHRHHLRYRNREMRASTVREYRNAVPTATSTNFTTSSVGGPASLFGDGPPPPPPPSSTGRPAPPVSEMESSSDDDIEEFDVDDQPPAAADSDVMKLKDDPAFENAPLGKSYTFSSQDNAQWQSHLFLLIVFAAHATSTALLFDCNERVLMDGIQREDDVLPSDQSVEPPTEATPAVTTVPVVTPQTITVPTVIAPVAAAPAGEDEAIANQRSITYVPMRRGPSVSRIPEVEPVGEDVLRHVEQLDTLINANATLKSFKASSPRRPSRSQKQIMGYLEKKARTALGSDVVDPDAPNGLTKTTAILQPLQTIGSGDLSDTGDFKVADASFRRKSTRKSLVERLSSVMFDASDGTASSSVAGDRKSSRPESRRPSRAQGRNSRLDSRRRSSVTASIKGDVSKFKQTVSRMFDKASQIKLDEERTARVAELWQRSDGPEYQPTGSKPTAQGAQYTISIHSTFRQWWDFVLTASIAYVIVMTPIKVGFDVQSSGLNYALDVVVDVIYLIEMVLNFFTSYEDDATGEEIKELDKIRRSYLQSWFLIDAVSSFPSSLVGTTNGLLTLSKILKVARVAKISDSGLVRTVSGHIDRSMNPSMLRMLKLTVIFLVSQHLIACTYYYISLNQSIDTTWAPTHDIRNSDSLGQQYVDAFYFAIMVTTANDVNPITPIEKLFTSVMLFVGIVINASIIGSAANLLANLDKEEIARKNHMDSINDYLRFKKVPLGLQNKIRRYYDYALTTRLQDPTENLFVDLPDRLKLLLKLNLHSDFVRKVPLFRALSHSGVVAIIQCLVPIVAMPGEIIIVYGEVAKEFYFIKTGQVSLCVPGLDDSIPLGNLGEGSFFGETSLLTGEPTTAEVKAERVCELMYLSKDNFETIVDRFPTFFLAVRRISESRLQTAQNIQKMSKMNRRPTQMLKIKKLSLRGVAQAAVLKARLGDHSETNKAPSSRSERVGSVVGNGMRLLSTGRRKSIPSFSANFIERLSLAQARHLTHLRSMRDMQQNNEEDAFWD
ncbi:WASH complex, subunit CCDC53 [Phytophthora cactorum]|nr:WASH complex, subunit CCDC53 [Phytophthora cactorum]